MSLYTADIAAAAQMIREAGALCTLTRPDATYANLYGVSEVTAPFEIDGAGSLTFAGDATVTALYSLAAAGALTFSGTASVADTFSIGGTGVSDSLFAIFQSYDLQTYGLVFTGPAGRSYVDVNGVVQTAGSNLPRSIYNGTDRRHYINGIPTILLEGQCKNLCLQSENFGTTWSAVGTPTRTPAAHTASGVSLDLIGDDDATASEYYQQTVTFTGDGQKAISVYVKQGTSTTSAFRIRDNTAAAYRCIGRITWSAGLPVITMGAVGTSLGYDTLADGVFRIKLLSAPITAANTNVVAFHPANDQTLADVATVGNIYAGGVQCEDTPFCTSYKKTTTATVTQAAEVAYFPYLWAPQEQTVFIKGVELGGILVTGSNLWGIQDAAGDAPYLLGRESSGRYGVQHYNGTASRTSIQGAAPTIGQTEELRSVLSPDGSVLSGQSVNAAAETLAAQSAASALLGAWSGQRLYLNSSGTTGFGFFAFQTLLVLRGTHTLAECRQVAA